MAFSFSKFRKHLAQGDTRLQRYMAGKRWQAQNAAALAHPPAASDECSVFFPIRLISKARSEDWAQVEKNLATTLATLHRQTNSNWRAAVCGQDRPSGIDFGDKVQFLPFDRPDVFDDKAPKGRQLLLNFLRHEKGAGYYFPLDADDLIHPGLVEYLLTDNNHQGYIVTRGYMLDHATHDLAVLQPADAEFPEATEFERSCGSSSALWFDFRHGADFATVLKARGNHRKVARNMGYFGFKTAEIPFHAAIYVMNHGENMRKKRGLMDGKMMHFDVNAIKDPARQKDVADTYGFAEVLGPPPQGNQA